MADSNIIAERTPFPRALEEFKDDIRIHFDKNTQTWVLHDEREEEWEWLESRSKWVPLVDEALIKKQQEAYSGPTEGEDENVPDAAEEAAARKRKALSSNADEANGKAKKQKAEPLARKNNAIYVTSLPEDVTVDEVHQVFSRFGVIAESADDNTPRIKLYTDAAGKFKGDALIVYFRPESVHLAIDMLDETDFRLGQTVNTGPMRVNEADSSFKAQKERTLDTEKAKTKGTVANRDRQKLIKKNEEMNSRLADWDDDDPQVIKKASSRWDKVVVLKHMFTPEELAKDPVALLEIKEDVREECEKFGEVTNVILYDKEAEGVVTVRFSDPMSAANAVKIFDGRMFDCRKVEAYIADGKERFKKSKQQDEKDEDEQARLEGFSKFIEGEGS